MRQTVFYSWQSDLPNGTNRGFIERALDDALIALAETQTDVDPVVDRDTVGVPGSPDIAATILAKIDSAAVFVADVSIVLNPPDRRPTPNPNVLIELGYALRSLGPSRVILVMNTAFGGPELLPFDLRMRRVTTYAAVDGEADRSVERKRFAGVLATALQLALREMHLSGPTRPQVTTTEIAVEAVSTNARDRGRRVRTFLDENIAALDTLHPGSARGMRDYDERLLASLAGSVSAVESFTRVVDAIGDADDGDTLREVEKQFEQVLERYRLRPDQTGPYTDLDFDFYRFLGHELLVTIAATLLRYRRWKQLRELVEHGFYVRNAGGTPRLVNFDYASRTIMSLQHRKERLQLRRLSLHADILFERHGDNGPLSRVMPMIEFMEADFLLFLRGEVQSAETEQWPIWTSWSTLYLDRHVPRYLVEAESTRFAEVLATTLGAPDVGTMKVRMIERIPKVIFDRLLGQPPVDDVVLQRIATKL